MFVASLLGISLSFLGREMLLELLVLLDSDEVSFTTSVTTFLVLIDFFDDSF